MIANPNKNGMTFVYIVKFSKNNKPYEYAFTSLDHVRVHLTYGWELPYDESKLIDTDSKGVIYDQDGITITQMRLVKS